MRQLTKRLVQPLRLAAGWFALDPNSYVGADGCIRTGASFIAWNQVEGDYLEFGVFEGASFAEAFRSVERQRRIVAKHVARPPALEQWLAAKPRFFAFDSFGGLPDGEADRHADYGAERADDRQRDGRQRTSHRYFHCAYFEWRLCNH